MNFLTDHVSLCFLPLFLRYPYLDLGLGSPFFVEHTKLIENNTFEQVICLTHESRILSLSLFDVLSLPRIDTILTLPTSIPDDICGHRSQHYGISVVDTDGDGQFEALLSGYVTSNKVPFAPSRGWMRHAPLGLPVFNPVRTLVPVQGPLVPKILHAPRALRCNPAARALGHQSVRC